jgi:hypothetical protein
VVAEEVGVIDIVRKVDERAQAVVDVAMAWLIRRGIRKASIVYTLLAAYVVTLLGYAWQRVSAGDGMWLLALYGFIAALWVHTAHVARATADTEEKRGLRPTRSPGWWRAWVWVALAISISDKAVGGYEAGSTSALASHVFMLLNAYAVGSPSTPPPAKLAVRGLAPEGA